MKVSESNDLPDMSQGVQMFFQNIVIELIYKQNDHGFLDETPTVIKTQGVRVTQTSRQLAMKPEGERKWKWSTLFMVPDPKRSLKEDDRLKIHGIKYRVMSDTSNLEYGVASFELIEDYDEE